MPASFVAQLGGDNAAGASTNLYRPAGTTSGMLMLGIVQVWPQTANINPPGDGSWTAVTAKILNTSGGTAARVFSRVDDGSAGPWAFDTTGATTWRASQTVTYSGQKATTPVEASSSAASGASLTTGTFAAVTTLSANAMVVAFDCLATGRVVTWTGGFTDRLGGVIPVAEKLQVATAGVTPSDSYSDFSWSIGFAISIAEAVAGPGGTGRRSMMGIGA